MALGDTASEFPPTTENWGTWTITPIRATSVRGFLAAGETESERAALRRCTRTGRPLGSEEFLQALEAKTHRRLAPQKGGRPRKQVADKRQAVPALTP